jgi:hypothetical protein
MSKVVTKSGKARKSTAGIPRVTNKVLAGGEALAKYNEAVAKLSPAIQAECKARLEAAQKTGPKESGGGKIGSLTRKVEKLTVALADAKTALDAAILAKGADEENRLNNIIAKANQEIELLKAAKSRSASAVQA